MRPDGTWSGICVGAVAAALLLAAPIAAPASTHGVRPTVTKGQPPGVVFGGLTSQSTPIVLETSKTGRQVVRAVVGLRLSCASGGIDREFDGYVKLTVKNRKFGASFGPVVQRNDDGTTIDAEGSIAGSFNRARTKATGTWRLKLTFHDAAGAVTDTCDSGSVSWSAKQ